MHLKFIAVLIFWMLPILSFSEELSAEKIATEVYRHSHGLRVDVAVSEKKNGKVATLINRGRDGRISVNTFESYLKSNFNDASVEAKSLAIFKSGKQRGVGILMTSYVDARKKPSLLMWLPALRKVRRFSAPAHDDFWAGSIFTFGEVFFRRPEHETHEVLGKTKVDYCLNTLQPSAEKQLKKIKIPEQDCSFKGRKIYQLKSATLFADWWYDYHISDIDQQTLLPYKTIYYKSGQKIKEINIAWRKGNGVSSEVYYPHYLYAQMLTNGFESLFFVPEETVSWNSDLSERFWSERTLRKIKR